MMLLRVGWLSLFSTVALAADRDGSLRLVEAAKNRDRAALVALLNDGTDVDVRRPDGVTALAWAAHWDDLEAANELGVTPLALACVNGSAPMVGLLL